MDQSFPGLAALDVVRDSKGARRAIGQDFSNLDQEVEASLPKECAYINDDPTGAFGLGRGAHHAVPIACGQIQLFCRFRMASSNRSENSRAIRRSLYFEPLLIMPGTELWISSASQFR